MDLTMPVNCVISKDDSTGVMTARLNNGTIFGHATDMLKILNMAQAVLPDPCTVWIAPAATPYLVGAVEGTGLISKNTTIFGYGARLFADTSHLGGEIFKVVANQKSLMVAGLDIDVNRKFGCAIGGGTGSGAYAPKLVHVKDVTIRNYYSYGIFVNDLVQGAPSSLIVENVDVDAGGVNGLNECIETNSVTNVTLRNVTCKSNKPLYLSGANITIDGISTDTTGYTGTRDLHVQGGMIDLKNLNLTETLLLLRPYGDTELNQPYYRGRIMRVRGLYSNNASIGSVRVDAYNDTNGGIDELVLHDLDIVRGEVVLDTYRNSYINTHGQIGIVDIHNLHLQSFSSNRCLLLNRNNDIGLLRLNTAAAPAAMATDQAASILRFENNLSSITVGEIDVSHVMPAPPMNLAKVADGNSGNSCNLNISRTVANGATGVAVSGTPVVNATMAGV